MSCGAASAELRSVLFHHFGRYLSKPVIKNMQLVVDAVLLLSTSNRGWYGRLSLWGIARCMGLQTTLKARRKRLGRFLCSKRYAVDAAMRGLLSFSGVLRWGDVVPVLLDQTSLCKDAVQAIVASFVHGTRSVPFDVCTFAYEGIKGSQNLLEWGFIRGLLQRLRPAVIPALVMDRGYAKLRHISNLAKENALYIIRGCRAVMVEYHDNKGSHRVSLGRLPHRQGIAVRYRNVKYRDDGAEVVDIVLFHGRGHAEPWFLILPPGKEELLPTATVVQWYRWRMRIETTFRDFKSHLGVRKGLHLLNDQCVRISRIMVCLAISYMLLLALGGTQEAADARRCNEVRRRKSRHGTRTTLSTLTVALMTLEQLRRMPGDVLGQTMRRILATADKGLLGMVVT